MTYVLNDASVLSVSAATHAAKADGQGFWQRLYAAMIESRRRSAMRELRAHAFLIGESGLVLDGASDTSLPFNR